MARTPRYPVMLDLVGRPCLVIGGGTVADRKVRGLVDAGAQVTVVAPALGESLADLVASSASGSTEAVRGGAATIGAVTWIERRVNTADPEPVLDLMEPPAGPQPTDRSARWQLVVVATDDVGLNATLAATFEASGVWVVDASSPTGGSVSTPAVHRAGPVTIAVSTSGVSPSAAGWLRDELAGALDPAVVEVLELLEELIADQASAAPAPVTSAVGAQRAVHTRVDWKLVLDSGTLDDIRHGLRARAKERLKACLS